ncbi:MAG: methyltransferase domain-containing protein [Acidobacteriales bacterium]|nr:methyltransferase domain-containing protein [Terriglobales bacterium]
MSLQKLKTDWEHLAATDPLWAILTDHQRAGRQWNIDDFMATGTREIDRVLAHLASRNLLPDPSSSALDFGCGVGRLTQPLARRFRSAVGIDISSPMVAKAQALNPPANCTFQLNNSSTLPFADASFGFIYSSITLQHIPPRFALQYLREFVRVLAPSGILVFQVPERYAGTFTERLRNTLRLRTRLREALHLAPPFMKMHTVSRQRITRALAPAQLLDTQYTNSALPDFNGDLRYLDNPPASGFVSIQYAARK